MMFLCVCCADQCLHVAAQMSLEQMVAALKQFAAAKYPHASDGFLHFVAVHVRPLVEGMTMPPLAPVWRCGDDIAKLLDAHQGTLQSLFVAFAHVNSMDAAVNGNVTVPVTELLSMMRTFDIIPTLLSAQDVREVCPTEWMR